MNSDRIVQRVSFYGDGSLPGYKHRGHFEYGPERNGVPAYLATNIPRELWGVGYDNPGMPDRDREYYRQWDHRHLLPWVPLKAEDKNTGYGVAEGQGQGVALVKRTANYTVLGCWDRTGDPRGNCWALFWVKGQLSANDMIAVIARDFPRIWERITKPNGMSICAHSDPDPETGKPIPVAVEPYDNAIPDDFFAQCLGETVSIESIATGKTHERTRMA